MSNFKTDVSILFEARSIDSIITPQDIGNPVDLILSHTSRVTLVF